MLNIVRVTSLESEISKLKYDELCDMIFVGGNVLSLRAKLHPVCSVLGTVASSKKAVDFL